MSAPLIVAYVKDKIAEMWGAYQSSGDIVPRGDTTLGKGGAAAHNEILKSVYFCTDF